MVVSSVTGYGCRRGTRRKLHRTHRNMSIPVPQPLHLRRGLVAACGLAAESAPSRAQRRRHLRPLRASQQSARQPLQHRRPSAMRLRDGRAAAPQQTAKRRRHAACRRQVASPPAPQCAQLRQRRAYAAFLPRTRARQQSHLALPPAPLLLRSTESVAAGGSAPAIPRQQHNSHAHSCLHQFSVQTTLSPPLRAYTQ